jgi:5-methylcytosine-specific restriction enzyme subunit McrC
LTKLVELVETQESTLLLDEMQFQHLSSLSRSLASSKSWWGSPDEFQSDRRVIRINSAGPGSYRVMVRDAVGVVSLPGLNILIRPKIDEEHFSYIARYAYFSDPRTVDSEVKLSQGNSFHELVMTWFLEEVNSVYQRGLQTDYEHLREELRFVRGGIVARTTFTNISRGRMQIDCEFDERTQNTPANRLIKSALETANFSLLPNKSLQARAEKMRAAFSRIPNASAADVKLSIRNVERRYQKAVEFAQSIIAAKGISLFDGQAAARTFLVRTPDLIEAGLRKIIAIGLAPIPVKKSGKALTPSMTVTPDLSITQRPFTADIKYKKTGDRWNRNDLAQGVFFAEAFKSPIAAVISFSTNKAKLEDVPVGSILVKSIQWDLSQDNPAVAAAGVIEAFSSWLPEDADEWLIQNGVMI